MRGKLLRIKLEKLLTFNSLQTKAHRGRWAVCKEWEKEEEGAKRDKNR